MATLRQVLQEFKPYDPLEYNGSPGGYNADLIMKSVPDQDLAREVVYHNGGYHYADAEGNPEPGMIFKYYQMTEEEGREAYRH